MRLPRLRVASLASTLLLGLLGPLGAVAQEVVDLAVDPPHATVHAPAPDGFAGRTPR